MKNLSIKARLIAILAVFVIISSGSVIYSLVNIRSQKGDTQIINLAGRQRALTQALAKSVFGLHHSAEEDNIDPVQKLKNIDFYRSDLIEKKKVFNDTLTAFANGGTAVNSEGNQVIIQKTLDKGLSAKLEESRVLWDKFSKQIDVIIAGINNTGDPGVDAAIEYIEQNNMPLFKDMNKVTLLFQGLSDSKLIWFKNFLYIGLLLNLMTFGAVIWLFHRLIIARLAALHQHMQDITSGEGDLTKRVKTESSDEIDVLGQEFNLLLGNFEVVISRLMGSTSLLKNSSEGLSSTFSTMVDGIGIQDQKTSQVATAMEEMSATVVEVARSASNMAEVAANADNAVKSGEVSVNKVIGRMNDIAQSTRNSAAVVGALGVESQKIGNIIQVINDIADQTNLLALNAAIEAARAGDQGRGFAVVADEVRKLAERTTRATKEIDVMIRSIQEESRKAVESIQKESATVDEGVLLTKEAGAALLDITDSIKNVTYMIQQIATSTEEQSAVASTISADMETVAGISKDSSREVRKVSSLAHDLSSLALEIEGSLSRFKVSASMKKDTGAEPDDVVVPISARLAMGDA
ncbi:MAG: type IV pili methyl-accepting chemotaxis transducer N-terminal domain-containing protein [Deltaproteobacteria bacterium]|nr:type IV pili methyl-accepting chemotaxis transducer N-terminal domain-containing protein [Deltaproteobacteria bacterium]